MDTNTESDLNTLVAEYNSNRAYFDAKGTAKSATQTRQALQDIIVFAKNERKTVQDLRKTKAAEKKAAKAE